ncbi:hypothetical protein EV385_0439 [Krasilnikovia cinnamomea]|uniref:Uncharacterized protein n=2 Tax=Krasilnikovia cinnamomea TaxID=349313 RepID=A0A4Q7ZDG6_9ACTN|nr:hypothetical protein EV385_0439 [Krasilnikovia cinnamomea]
MPSNQYDAALKLVYFADVGTFFASDTVANGEPFDVIGNVEIGKELMENVRDFKLYVKVVNLSRSTLLLAGEVADTLTAQDAPYNAELRLSFRGGWHADDGDVLQAIASYRVNTSLYNDYSTMNSHPVVVAAGR